MILCSFRSIYGGGLQDVVKQTVFRWIHDGARYYLYEALFFVVEKRRLV
jgi:hypothetical protein